MGDGYQFRELHFKISWFMIINQIDFNKIKTLNFGLNIKDLQNFKLLKNEWITISKDMIDYNSENKSYNNDR